MTTQGNVNLIGQVVRKHRQSCQALHEGYPLLGLVRGHHQNKRGEAMSFADKPYMVPLLAKLPEMEGADICKAPQTGLTEAFIALALYNAGWRDRICAYMMPTSGISNRFVSQRLDPLLWRVPAYAERTPGGDWGDEGSKGKGNLKTKKFGRRGALMFMGAKTEADFVEFSADMVVVDEYDVCDLTYLEQIPDRIRESPYPQLFRISNPRIPGKGISKRWAQGDRSKWYHQCPRCKEHQPLDWFANFIEQDDSGAWRPRDRKRENDISAGDLRPVCRRCKEPWERSHLGSIWVAEAPGKRVSLHISRLDVLATDKEPQPCRRYFREWLAAEGDMQKLVAFFMGVLGWAYEAQGSRVTQHMLDKAMLDQPLMDYHGTDMDYEQATVVMGVDVGSLLNVKISVIEEHPTNDEESLRRAVRICTVPRFEDLYDLQQMYSVDTIVIDALPETKKAKEVRDHFNEADLDCKVWLCQYHSTGKVGADAFGIRLNYDEQVVTVDRTQLLDTTMADIAQGLAVFPSDSNLVLGFTDQMRAPIRRLSERGDRFVWDEGSDPDHYRHADAYERVAQEIGNRGGRFFG